MGKDNGRATEAGWRSMAERAGARTVKRQGEDVGEGSRVLDDQGCSCEEAKDAG